MTISTTTDSSLPARTGWTFRDTLWMLGVYGATVGAGTLFLPVEIGTRGPLVFLLLLVLGIPLSLVPHVLICRVFMRDNQPDDGTLPLFGAFLAQRGERQFVFSSASPISRSPWSMPFRWLTRSRIIWLIVCISPR